MKKICLLKCIAHRCNTIEIKTHISIQKKNTFNGMVCCFAEFKWLNFSKKISNMNKNKEKKTNVIKIIKSFLSINKVYGISYICLIKQTCLI